MGRKKVRRVKQPLENLNTFKFRLGQRILCLFKGFNYDATIIDIVLDGSNEPVYKGWNSRFDEQIEESEANTRFSEYVKEKADETKQLIKTLASEKKKKSQKSFVIKNPQVSKNTSVSAKLSKISAPDNVVSAKKHKISAPPSCSINSKKSRTAAAGDAPFSRNTQQKSTTSNNGPSTSKELQIAQELKIKFPPNIETFKELDREFKKCRAGSRRAQFLKRFWDKARVQMDLQKYVDGVKKQSATKNNSLKGIKPPIPPYSKIPLTIE